MGVAEAAYEVGYVSASQFSREFKRLFEFHLNYQQTKVNQHVLNINQTWSISMNLPTTMKIVEITVPGGPEVLKLQDSNVPVPQADEVLIEVKAAGINRPDVLQRMGLYPMPKGLLKSLDLKSLE